MKVSLFTNEYPPHIYGGAGIHVSYLSRELAKLCRVDVRCFGDQREKSNSLSVTGFGLNDRVRQTAKPLQTVLGAIHRCMNFNTASLDADLVHVHTWYTHFGGVLAKLQRGLPLVLTTHSLEPLRPWKREQLAGAYDFSCWIEKTAIEMADAVIAVSRDAKEDILKYFKIDPGKIHVIHNGIDPEEFRPVKAPDQIQSLGIDPSMPFLLFVGRITRQKGIIHLVNAIRHMDPDFQIVLCAGAPDTDEIAREMKSHVIEIRKIRKNVIWIQDMLDLSAKIALYSHAACFCCPSVYEPFGIINLEAMACETPVVASAVGGIKEVVVDGETGFLVPLELDSKNPFEPEDPGRFEKDLAMKINAVMKDPDGQMRMGKAGRRRAEEFFSWSAIAEKTYRLYQSLLQKP